VYGFYEEKGFWCIALKRFLKLLTTFFVISFTTFLTSCIDYSKLRHSVGPNNNGRLEDALVGQCLTRGSFWHMLFLFLVCITYVFQLGMFVLQIPGLVDMYRFYNYLLGVPDVS
jgi:autophagy-related protein 9